MHGEFLCLLQAPRETETHLTAAGMSSQHNQLDSFRFKRAAFYQSLKSKVGLAAANDDVFYLFLQKQKSAQSYNPQG
jgi:hypothetical protein